MYCTFYYAPAWPYFRETPIPNPCNLPHTPSCHSISSAPSSIPSFGISLHPPALISPYVCIYIYIHMYVSLYHSFSLYTYIRISLSLSLSLSLPLSIHTYVYVCTSPALAYKVCNHKTLSPRFPPSTVGGLCGDPAVLVRLQQGMEEGNRTWKLLCRISRLGFRA